MYHNVIFNGINDALPPLLRLLLRKGDETGSRNGAVKELTHIGTTLCKPWQREILLPDRKANIAAQIAETMWVLTGRNDMDFLSKYLPRATDYSDDGETWRGAYGPRLRAWNVGFDEVHLDQWGHCLDLLRQDPLTRRAVMSIYDPEQDAQPGLDIPCNNWLTFSSRLGKLDLHVGIRSNDILWGWSGINAFEWSALLEISAGLLGVQVGSVHFSTTSLHLYAPHWAKGEAIARENWPHFPDLLDSPRFNSDPKQGNRVLTLQEFDGIADDWFMIEGKIREGHNRRGTDYLIEQFPEPMLRSWLRVIQWWWTGDHSVLKPLAGTRLEYATHVSMQPPVRTRPAPAPVVDLQAAVQAATSFVHDGRADHVRKVLAEMHVPRVSALKPEQVQPFLGKLSAEDTLAAFVGGTPPGQPTDFIRFAIRTHDEKDAAYGDSWKKRGEVFSIIPNVARKVDRLGGSDTSDETSADTAMDLLVYLAKYRTFLDDRDNLDDFFATSSDSTKAANDLLMQVDRQVYPNLNEPVDVGYVEGLNTELKEQFERLLNIVTDGHNDGSLVDAMLVNAYRLAIYLWGSQRGTAKAWDGDDYRGADRD